MIILRRDPLKELEGYNAILWFCLYALSTFIEIVSCSE